MDFSTFARSKGALPIDEALPRLTEALAALIARRVGRAARRGQDHARSAGAARADWRGDGKIIVLEPRRLAARAAAERMAGSLGERSRGNRWPPRAPADRRSGPKTRVEVVTEGVFARMILDDPALDGVAAVLFDEFHERSLDADLGLALALDAQAALRPDLRLLVMSATLDGARVAALLDDAPVIESQGRAFPVETRPSRPRPARADRSRPWPRDSEALWPKQRGSVLAFLPGQGEITRTDSAARAKSCATPPSISARFMAPWTGRRRTAPSARPRRGGARWCWPPRSPKPRSPSTACGW